MITRPLEPGTWDAFAALVERHDGVGWCQFGPPAELPRVPNRKAYEQGPLELIAGLGGGVVEGYPEDAGGRKVSSSFLYHGTVAQLEAQGFERVRKVGKHRWVMAKTVGP